MQRLKLTAQTKWWWNPTAKTSIFNPFSKNNMGFVSVFYGRALHPDNSLFCCHQIHCRCDQQTKNINSQQVLSPSPKTVRGNWSIREKQWCYLCITAFKLTCKGQIRSIQSTEKEDCTRRRANKYLIPVSDVYPKVYTTLDLKYSTLNLVLR